MKKSLLTLITLALVRVNLVLTAITAISIIPEVKQANELVAKVSEAIDLDVESASGVSGRSNIPISDLVYYNLADKITVNLKPGSDGNSHMAVLTVSLELNSKHKDFTTLQGNLDTQNNMISSEISSIVSSYTYDNIQDSMNEIQQTVKERLAGIFGNEFVVGVNITPLYQ